MFLKKENALDFSCQSCGNCCKYFSINITHLDVQRILENRKDLKPVDIVSFSACTDKDDQESFVATYGKRQMTLKKKPNSEECVFLKNNMCTIHDFKPRVCKVWPFSLEKGNEIGWIKEHRNFIKKKCAHTMESGANDPEELIPLLRQHYKERKMFIKLVEKWNEQKKNEIKDGEIFSDILDEHFFDFILGEMNIKSEIEIEVEKEDNFLESIISVLTTDRKIEAILASKYADTYSKNRNPDLSFNIFIKHNNFNSFIDSDNLKKIRDKIEAEKYSISYDNRTIYFYIKDKYIIVLHIYDFDDIHRELPYDTKVIYNPYSINLNISPMYKETKESLEKIYNVFWLNIKQIIKYIQNDNFLDAKIMLNSSFNQDLCGTLYWLNQKNFNLSDINFLTYKTDDLNDFILKFGNYKNKEEQIKHLKDFIDIFQRTWKLTGLSSDYQFENIILEEINKLL